MSVIPHNLIGATHADVTRQDNFRITAPEDSQILIMNNVTKAVNKHLVAEPVYVRRVFATVIIFLITLCSTYFFVKVADAGMLSLFFLLDHVIEGYRAKVIGYLYPLSMLAVAVAYFVKLLTFASVVGSPHFLFQERRQPYRFLIPPAISLLCIFGWCIFVYLLGSAITFDIPRVMEWIAYLDFLLSTLAIIAMLQPRSDNILARCFIPFIETNQKASQPSMSP